MGCVGPWPSPASPGLTSVLTSPPSAALQSVPALVVSLPFGRRGKEHSPTVVHEADYSTVASTGHPRLKTKQTPWVGHHQKVLPSKRETISMAWQKLRFVCTTILWISKLCSCVSVRWYFIELVWWLNSKTSSFWANNLNFTTSFQGLETLHQLTIAFI